MMFKFNCSVTVQHDADPTKTKHYVLFITTKTFAEARDLSELTMRKYFPQAHDVYCDYAEINEDDKDKHKLWHQCIHIEYERKHKQPPPHGSYINSAMRFAR